MGVRERAYVHPYAVSVSALGRASLCVYDTTECVYVHFNTCTSFQSSAAEVVVTFVSKYNPNNRCKQRSCFRSSKFLQTLPCCCSQPIV